MSICFVIQPFDKGRFDKRYADIFKPAITAAELEPYRVDEDANADVPIEAIEQQIRASQVCLADITMDNPNVWYELGFAFASKKPVVMVCSSERQPDRYPFDIQHRHVIRYQNESTSDFAKLQQQITERLVASVNRAIAMDQIAERGDVSPVQGLSQPELTVLASLAASLISPDGCETLWSLKNDVEKAGLTSIAFQLGIRRLLGKGLIERRVHQGHYDDEPAEGAALTDSGWQWIDEHEELFVMRRSPKARAEDAQPIPDDDIPF